MVKAVLPAVAILMMCAVVGADMVTLSNGDKISGTINEVNLKGVVITTPYAGKVTIERAAVKALQSEKAVAVVTPQGEREARYLSPLPAGTGWRETPIALPPPPAVAAAPARRTSYLYLGPDWKNQISLGAVNTTGNDQTTSVDAGLTLHYEKKPEELTVKFETVYGVTFGTQTAGLADQNTIYRYELSDRWYLYADDDVRYDAIKGISLQADASSGAGYYLFRGKRFKLDVRGGPGVNYLKTFDNNQDVSVAVEAGVRGSYAINDRLSATHETIYTTSLSDYGNWRLHSESALQFKLDLERGLGLKLGFNDDYENQPSAGTKNNDTRVTLSLTLDF